MMISIPIFASYERSGTWVGLDLGKEHVITKIGFAPRNGQKSRVQLAVIEGANNPDFGDAIPLYIIPEAAEENKMTFVDVKCTRGFRYVRYVTPHNVRCNLSELQFFGYEGKGDDFQLYQLTQIPVVSIHTVNSEDVVIKKLYLKGIIKIISENGTHFFTDSTQIRGRGNASWSFPKKPYKLKLYNKAGLLNFPAKEKKWTLINNYGDKTLMRNLLAFDISKRFNMDFTPAGAAVDLILNGEYKGTYQLCDQVEVAKKRVDITKMKKQDVALPDLSGGYLIEIDAYAYSEDSWFESKRKIPVTIKHPNEDDIVKEQTNYITNFFNQMEDAVHGNFMSENANYRNFLDTETFLKNFLIGEFCGNTDTYWSTYMYKDRNSSKLFTGPIWDYDLAFENDNRTYPINNLDDFIFRTKGSAANGMRTFVSNIIASEQSQKEISDLWSKTRESGVITHESMTRLVDSLANLIAHSADLNFKRWPILNQKVHQNPYALGSFQAEVDAVKKYIHDRIDWMDKKVIIQKNEPEPEPEKPPIGKIFVSNSMLTIKDYEHEVTHHIYDIQGRTIATKRLQPRETYRINLFPGVYIIKLHDETNGQIENQKIIVR